MFDNRSGRASSLVRCLRSTSCAKIGAVGLNPIVLEGIHLTSRSQGSGTKVIVDVAIVNGNGATGGRAYSVGAVVGDFRIADPSDPSGPICQDPIVDISREVALVGG